MSPIKILLLEDSPPDQEAFKRAVRKMEPPIDVTIAETIAEAKKLLSSQSYDVIIADHHVSDGCGTELVDEFSKSHTIIMMTGTGNEEVAVKSLKAGAKDYLIKDPAGQSYKLLPTAIERAIQQTNQEKEIERLASIKEDFIGIVSHELRTPLTVIGLGIENLLAGTSGPVTQEQAKSLERNVSNVKRLNKLINDLLDLSRLESGHVKIRRKEVNLNSLIHEVLQSFEGVEKKLMKNLPNIEADPDMISQILTNLLSDAARYAKSKIVVSTNVIKNKNGAPAFVETSVFNDGPSIPDEDQKKLFEKFAQLDREKQKSSYKGTGLGLAICKESVEQHGGKIWVESREKHGIKFCFTLPIHPERNEK